MYPHLTLKIRNHVPHIYFYPEEGMSRQLTLKDENIMDEIRFIGEKLGFNQNNLTDSEQIAVLFDLTSEADNLMIETLPEVDIESLEFDIHNTLESILNRELDKENEYSDMEMPDEVRNELNRNRNSNILASIIDQLYDIIIAKTLLAAYELEIDSIHLDNEHNYARFVEKFGKELQKLGLELTIDNLDNGGQVNSDNS